MSQHESLTSKDVFTLPPAIYGNDRVGMTREYYDRLTARNAELESLIDDARSVMERQIARRDELVKALNFYASGRHYRVAFDGDDVLTEYGQTAIAALKESAT